MNKRRRMIAVSVASIGLVGIVFVLLLPREPTYQGKTPTRWFKEFLDYPRSLVKPVSVAFGRGGRVLIDIQTREQLDDPPMEGLRRLGVQAVPCLVKALKRRDTALTKIYKAVYAKAPPTFRRMLPAPSSRDEIRANAVLALAGMGDAAKPAIPALIDALRQEPLRSYNRRLYPVALSALKSLGVSEEQINPLVQEFSRQHRDSDVLNIIAVVSSKNRTAALALASVVMQGKDTELRRAAVMMLEKMGPDAKPAISDLTLALTDRDHEVRYLSARALGEIGPDAADAVPALIKALADDNNMVQSAAMRSLRKIAPDPVMEGGVK